jgi:hypothetical protein
MVRCNKNAVRHPNVPVAKSARQRGSMSNSQILKTLALALIATVFGCALRADASTYKSDSASEWSGDYWYQVPHSTISMQLVITRDSRFHLTDIGCFGSSEINHGSVVFRDGVLVLDPELPSEQGFGYQSKAMIPVNWKERLYLVNSNRVGEFIEAIREGAETCTRYCQGFFIRESDLPD